MQVKKFSKRSKVEMMREVERDITNLVSSPLYKYRTKNKYVPVVGEGNLDARIILIGEAPGKNEALTGRPFCGAAGKILDLLLASASIARENVYITSVVKDRPPENRNPTPKEIKSYAPFLDRQIEIIQPRVIATLGRFAMEYIMNKFGLSTQIQPMSKMHGKIYNIKASWSQNKGALVPLHIIILYHPSVASYSRSKLPELTSDFKSLTPFNKGR